MPTPFPRAPRPSGRWLRLWLTCLALALGGVTALPPVPAAVVVAVVLHGGAAPTPGERHAPARRQARAAAPARALHGARVHLARALPPPTPPWRARRVLPGLFLTHRALLL